MSTTRNGKIARLSREVREQLNRRIEDGEPGHRIVDWLNGLPEVCRMLAEDFGGSAINEQNLSNWRQGGHQDWLREQQIRKYCVAGTEVPEAVVTLEQLTTLMVARYLVLIRDRVYSHPDWEEMQTFCRDVCKFRQIEIQGKRLELDWEKLEFNREKLMEQKKSVAERVADVLLTLGPEVRAALVKGSKRDEDGGLKMEDGGAKNEWVGCSPSPQSSPPGRGGDLEWLPRIETITTLPAVGDSQMWENVGEFGSIKVNQGRENKKIYRARKSRGRERRRGRKTRCVGGLLALIPGRAAGASRTGKRLYRGK